MISLPRSVLAFASLLVLVAPDPGATQQQTDAGHEDAQNGTAGAKGPPGIAQRPLDLARLAQVSGPPKARTSAARRLPGRHNVACHGTAGLTRHARFANRDGAAPSETRQD
jgi:hypothetical protein